jgi:hypothetical protein
MAEAKEAVIPEVDPEEAALRSMAETFDRTGEVEQPKESETKSEDLASETKEGDGTEKAPGTEEPAGDESSTEGKSATESDKGSKFAKEQERREKSWKALNEQKEALQKEREAFERQRQELEAQRKQATEKPAPKSSEADEYEAVAKDFEAEGKHDLAARAREKAGEIRRREEQTSQQARQQEFLSKWNDNLSKEVEANPDLSNPETALHKDVAALLKKMPILSTYPEGIRDAVEYIKTKHEAGSAADLRKQVEEHKKKIEELNKRLEPSGSFPAPLPGGKKSFDQLSEKEQEAELRRLAEEADGRE